MSGPIDFELAIVERDRPDYSNIVFSLRRWGKDFGEGFSRWLASPSSARFLVMELDAGSIEEMIWNCSTEAELIQHLVRRHRAFLEVNVGFIPPAKFNLHTYVTPAIGESLQRMATEFREPRRRGRSPTSTDG